MKPRQVLLQILFACLIACGLSSTLACPALAQSQQPNPHRQADRQGFFDYALGKINPNGADYGANLQSKREGVVGKSIDDLYFWSNVLSLMLLIATAFTLLFHWRAADKREVIAASLIAQLWNGRVSDRIEIERRTGEFNRLADAHNAEIERSLMAKAQSSESRSAEESVGRSVRKLTEKPVSGVSSKDHAQLRLRMDAASEPTAADPSGMQQSYLLLQRRVEALQNSESSLKQRLNQTTVLLDQERRRNATLKGG